MKDNKITMNKEREKDKSWGMVGFYRNYGSGRELFGSDVTNHNTIRLTVKHAIKHRELGRDWTMGDDIICEVELSALQFAELLTNMNMGDGVPCTIRYTREDGYVDYKNEKSKRDVVDGVLFSVLVMIDGDSGVNDFHRLKIVDTHNGGRIDCGYLHELYAAE